MRNKTKRCKKKTRRRADRAERGEAAAGPSKPTRETARKSKRKAARKAKRKAARKAKRKAARKAKREAARKPQRPPFRKLVLALGGDPIAGFRVDLLRAHPGEELVYIQKNGLVVTDVEGNGLTSVPFRGEAGGGDALRIKGFVYHRKKTPAVVTIWNWCQEMPDGAIKCMNYEDTCWESKSGLECTGPAK